MKVWSYIPENIEKNPLFFEKRLGIKEKRRKPVDWAVSDLAVQVCKEKPEVLIMSSCSHDYVLSTNTALIVAGKMGWNIPAFDINSGCSSFIYEMYVANALKKKVLVIAADGLVISPENITYYYFSDGAGR
jgi:3-oxoacyl-[acyl-carrier-protein] synthase III